uniref:Type 1 phosphatases regulator n=1 Tax=Lotharella globosa TaxID=91324 RepID=A0A6U3AKW9_9EUKA|mmetsp:Transcript_179/g.300  ORF Transcript_179/g.300 Transcript_179/m.300 type:complete len:118 (+) Transcript_179:36-389(+)|eukprot:CAMPEP_0167793402 /NCGR_PEP_ID=MMETSP0111_2-20121227/13157_1 /TAXON_ID=91324 /ORGANISM="Lotharella globosa, Strain CCCM811" /LENGTH=117 /DNA_ID=CAMNT_0007686549 /DNA_START=25 /DNA_END=378 /DNA_ORIENTATION=-
MSQTRIQVQTSQKSSKHFVVRMETKKVEETKKPKPVKPIYKTPGSFEKVEKVNKGKKGIVWTEDTIDNEFMNKKSSKICCVYHKPRRFDESDSEESDFEKPQTYNPNQPEDNKQSSR